MPRVNYVKKAQQRYRMVQILDEQGQPKKVPVMNTRTGEQKVSKRGPVFRTLTITDKSQPLPLYRCGSCGKDIEVGTPYKWIEPKSGPYGGRFMARHASCPTWQVWEYSSSLSARIAQLQYEGEQALSAACSQEDIEAARDSIAAEIEALADEKEEAAQNMEDGFGHETYQSTEIRETADSLRSWGEEVGQAEVPEIETEQDCEDCQGTGEVECEDCQGEDCEACGGDGNLQCEACEGTGTVEAEEPSEDALEEAREAVRSVLDACPV